MQLKRFINFLTENKIPFSEKEIMKDHTTFRIGGAADVYLAPENTETLIAALKAAKRYDVPVFLLGNGSNIIVSDKGVKGAVVDMKGIRGISTEGLEITCFAGESLRKLCIAARDSRLSGLEFAYGIPGTVGGALYMNAGAYGGEMADVVESAVYLDNDYNVCEINADKMELGYRTSIFKQKGYIILSVKLKLNPGETGAITTLMRDIFKRRHDKQPLEYPSAGSTFKRPKGYYAGSLIEASGLKGKKVGGAQVSEKHAGFVINRKNATAKNVLSLIEIIKETVMDKYGVQLEEEIIFVGRR